MPSYPSGFGLIGIWPGVTSLEPPGYVFFRTGIASTVSAYFQAATGDPQTLFSVFSGEQVPLSLISGGNNDFYFNQGVMTFGNLPSAANRPDSGNLGIFWNGANSSPTHAGLMITQTNNTPNSGSPSVVIRSNSNPEGFGLDISSFLGNYAENKSDYGSNSFRSVQLPGNTYYTSANCFLDDDYTLPEVGGAVANFDGFGWGMWDGTDRLYTNLALHKDYTEVGYFEQKSTRQNLGGAGALVIRNAAVNPTTYHTSGTTLFSSANGSFNVRTSSGKYLQIGPGITGVDRVAYSSSVYRNLDFSFGTQAVIDTSFDGKIAVDSLGSSHSILFDSSLQNGFSCQILFKTSAGCSFDPGSFVFDTGPFSGPGDGERTFVNIESGRLFLSNSITNLPIRLNFNDLYPTLTSGAGTGIIETPTSARLNYKTLDFDMISEEHCQADVVLPTNWSSVKCEFMWTATSGAGNVKWGARAVAMEDGEPLEGAYGTPMFVIDAKSSNSGIQRTSFTSGVFPGGALGTFQNLPVKMDFYRDTSSIDDTLSADARLLGITLIKG